MTGAKAIETHYAGCRFRSRLEARWAVVFDHLNLPWQYEAQGYELPSGRYLPDFHIGTDQGFYIEIKGGMPNTREFEVASEINLYVKPLMIFCGDIPRNNGQGTCWWFDRIQNTWTMGDPMQELAKLVSEIQPKRAIAWTRRILVEGQDALTAGRSARFEHGENG